MTRLALLFLLIATPALATDILVRWTCNTEPDMKEYRGERSSDGGASWGVLFTKVHEPGCTELSHLSQAYVAPGQKLVRLFAIDKVGNVSNPSAPYAVTVTAPPIGNPGGGTEDPLPPSPVPPPPPPPVVLPSNVTDLAATEISTNSVKITFSAPAGAKVNVRYAPAPMNWGTARSASCEGSPCQLSGLLPGLTYDVQCIPYFGTMNQGAIYGKFCMPITVTTLPVITPPPPVPPPVVPPPPPTVTLRQALQDGLDTCLTKKLAHTACMKAIRDALGKVNP